MARRRPSTRFCSASSLSPSSSRCSSSGTCCAALLERSEQRLERAGLDRFARAAAGGPLDRRAATPLRGLVQPHNPSFGPLRCSIGAGARELRRLTSEPESPQGPAAPPTAEEELHMSDILLRPIIAMQVAVHQLREREDGQTTTEYAILLGFLAIAIIIALFFLRNVLRSLFSTRRAASRTGSGLDRASAAGSWHAARRGGPHAFSEGLGRTHPFGRLWSGRDRDNLRGPGDPAGQHSHVQGAGRAPLDWRRISTCPTSCCARSSHAGRGASAAGAGGWPDDDRVRDSARLPRYRHHHRAVLPEERAAQLFSSAASSVSRAPSS